MNGQRTTLLVLAMAAICIAGLVLMLLSESPLWDRAGFVLTALPLLVGGWRVRREAKSRA